MKNVFLGVLAMALVFGFTGCPMDGGGDGGGSTILDGTWFRDDDSGRYQIAIDGNQWVYSEGVAGNLHEQSKGTWVSGNSVIKTPSSGVIKMVVTQIYKDGDWQSVPEEYIDDKTNSAAYQLSAFGDYLTIDKAILGTDSVWATLEGEYQKQIDLKDYQAFSGKWNWHSFTDGNASIITYFQERSGTVTIAGTINDSGHAGKRADPSDDATSGALVEMVAISFKVVEDSGSDKTYRVQLVSSDITDGNYYQQMFDAKTSRATITLIIKDFVLPNGDLIPEDYDLGLVEGIRITTDDGADGPFDLTLSDLVLYIPKSSGDQNAPYIITGSAPSSFTATKNGAKIAGPLPIQDLIDAIRNHANGADCSIHFGNGSGFLDIGAAGISFANPAGEGGIPWGKIGLLGKLASSALPAAIEVAADVIVDSMADIMNTAAGGAAINNNGGTVNINGGTVSGGNGSNGGSGGSSNGGNAINTSNGGTTNINGGKINGGNGGSGGGNGGHGTSNSGGGTTNVNGGTVSGGNGGGNGSGGSGTNNSGGNTNISGGTVKGGNGGSGGGNGGSGTNNSGGNTAIKGGTVTGGNGGGNGSGGHGTNNSSGNTNISGGTVSGGSGGNGGGSGGSNGGGGGHGTNNSGGNTNISGGTISGGNGGSGGGSGGSGGGNGGHGTNNSSGNTNISGGKINGGNGGSSGGHGGHGTNNSGGGTTGINGGTIGGGSGGSGGGNGGHGSNNSGRGSTTGINGGTIGGGSGGSGGGSRGNGVNNTSRGTVTVSDNAIINGDTSGVKIGTTILDGTWRRGTATRYYQIEIDGNNWVYSEGPDGAVAEFSKGTWTSVSPIGVPPSSGIITLTATHTMNSGGSWQTVSGAGYVNTASYSINAAGTLLTISDPSLTTAGVWGTLAGAYEKQPEPPVTPDIDEFDGTWNASGDRSIEFTNGAFEYKVDGTTEYSGTFSVTATTITFVESTLGGSASGDFTLTDDTLILSNHTWDSSVNGTYTKE